MKKIFTLLLLCFVGTLFAQDTVYMNQDYKELKGPENAEFYKITEKVEGKNYVFVRRTYWMNGQIKAEQSYNIEDERKVYEGQHRHWYKSGEAFYMADFRKGIMDGNLIAFWKNGKRRRQDRFRKGQFVSGKVWNEQGEEIEHFPYLIPAYYPGGQEAMAKFLNTHAKKAIAKQSKIPVKVVVKFIIDEKGNPTEAEVLKGNSKAYNQEALRLVKAMPQWNPGKRFGVPVRTSFALPMVF